MRLDWDQVGQRLYETGVDRAVLYPQVVDQQTRAASYPRGYAWNGISNISETASGGESNKVYADNISYLNLLSLEECGATIEAFTYPDEFAECDGSKEVAPGVFAGQQKRKGFGLSYRSLIGNDTDETDFGYKLHLLYGCLAEPSDKSYGTVNESPEAGTFSWDVSTTPVSLAGCRPTASLTIDSTKTTPEKLAAIEDILYGTDETEARLPLPDEVVSILTEE